MVPGDRRLRQRLLPLDHTPRAATRRRSGARTRRAPPSPTPASRRSTRPASRSRGEYQSKLTLMSESLRNDGRIWVPKAEGRPARAAADPGGGARLLPGAHVPELRQPRAARHRLARGEAGVRRGARRRPDRSRRLSRLRRRDRAGWAKPKIEEKYGNLFEMYERITGENPYDVPMRIYPATHYTMGGLWVDYNLMSTIPGLFVLGEANFSDHGANRLGASRADAGTGRRLLRHPLHDRQLPRAREARARGGHAPRRPGRAGGRGRTHEATALDRRLAHRVVLPPRAGQDHVGALRHGAGQEGPGARHWARSPACARSSGRTCASRAPARS